MQNLMPEEVEMLCQVFIAIKAAWNAQTEPETRVAFASAIGLLATVAAIIEAKDD